MRIDICTLFPDSVDAMLNVSILGRAQERGYITIQSHQIRDYTTNKQMQVDDYPYGGGRGAVMQADPLYRCWDHIRQTYGPGRTIFLSPCGRTFTQDVARELKEKYDHLILVCGHYEGVDQRFLDECVDEEISMGDFVLTGGEIPAMAVCDAVCRMVPGVLPEEECFQEESHWDHLLEYPAPPSGTAGRCRRCSSAATTPTWPPGGARRATSAPSAAVRICSPSSTSPS
jgi:tRNA (guanine37-N1)-methyltransferase